MATLLSLPDEILVQTLCKLATLDILRCQATCFKLNAVIQDSTEIQYRLALEAAGLEDCGSSSLLSQAERLERVQRAQRAWRLWKPQFTKEAKVEHVPNHLYDLSGGIYLLGDRDMLTLKYLTLPQSPGDVPQWGSIPVDEMILDVGLCIDEHDLVVLVTSNSIPNEAPLFDIGIHFIQFSTGQPHPLALHQRILAYKNPRPNPGIGLEIVGENLVLILAHRPDRLADSSQAEDRVLVFEWKTGTLKMSITAPCRSYAGLIFLDEHLLLLPNTKRGVLEVWDLPRSATDPSPSVPRCILDLPPLAPGRSFGQLSCRSESNPIGEKSHTWRPNTARNTRAYKPKPEEAIIIFNLRVQPLQNGPHPIMAMGFSHTYTFFVHRKSILRAVLEHHPDDESRPPIDIDFPSTSALLPTPIPYEKWGQKTTKWLEADDTPTRWITTTSGQRAVLIGASAGNMQGSGSPILVIDFNQMTVRKVAHIIKERKRRKEEREEKRRRRVLRKLDRENAEILRKFKECKEWLGRIESQLGEIKAAAAAGAKVNDDATRGIDWPELDRTNVEDIKNFLEQNSELMQQFQPTSPSECVQEEEDDDDEDDNQDSPDVDDEDTNASYWCPAPYPVDRASACFHSPVLSELPCVGYMSKEMYHFDGVMIDDERVLGIKTNNNNDRVKNIQVFYFG